MADFIKCKYAGDKDDEFCCKCDGLNITSNGKTYSADVCEGYTMEETKPVTPVKAAKPVKTTKPPVKAAQVEVEPIETPAQTSDVGEIDTSHVETQDYAVIGMPTAIRAESGLTMEVKDSRGQSRWYKFGYTEERIIPSSANIEMEREALWACVHAEVDRQAQEIKN